MNYTLCISFQVNKTPLRKKKLSPSRGMFLADLLKSRFLKKNKNPAQNTFFYFNIYALQFRRAYAIAVTFFFLLQVYVENTCHGFSLIFLASCYQFPEQFIYIDHYAQFPYHFHVLFMSNSCFHFLIEPRLVFPTKTVLFLDDRMQLSDLTINSS